MKKVFASGAIAAMAVAAALVAPSAANALVYTSYLEYKNDAPNTKVTPFGEVILTEIGGDTVDVVVKLYDPLLGFLNTGNGDNKAPFTFNLTGDYDVTTFNEVAGQQFADGGYGAFQNNTFGIYTNKIDCCGGAQGGANYDPKNLHFQVYNSLANGGLTFAGVGATFTDGKLTGLGTGPQFASTILTEICKNPDKHTGCQTYPAGWWFSADVIQSGGATYNIAARDAYVSTGIPEPATWALMILGFGGAGAMLRRRRAAIA